MKKTNLLAQKSDLLTGNYSYHLPPELIATHPVSPRDSARLLVYDRSSKMLHHAKVSDLPQLIPANTSLILNNTKVIKARIFGQKKSAGKIELLYQKPIDLETHRVMIRGKVRPGTRLTFDHDLDATVLGCQDDGTRTVSFQQNGKFLATSELFTLLDTMGHIPLPPYIKREDDIQDATSYQSVFAKDTGSVAAPTASLHFTDALLQSLCSKFSCHELTLHVGSGTFAPVEQEHIEYHTMHTESYAIPQETVEILESDQKILAVGTTACRTVEHYARTRQANGECNLFLHPHNPPIRVDHLMTNFHLPKSTLIMLVAGFIGREKTLELYHTAIKEKYRFYSYGDAMLIV